MRNILLIFIFAVFLTGCGSSSSGSSSSDPNAEVIENTPVAGVIDQADGVEKLYGFEALSNAVYNVRLNWPDPASDLDLFITDGVDSYFTLADAGTVESINVAMAAGDLLAIAVNAFQTNGPQDFTIGASAVVQPAHYPGHVESEPNNDVPTGNIIGFGQVSGIADVTMDQDDYFVYVAPQAATYDVLLNWTGVQHDLDLFIGWDTGTANSILTNTESEIITQALNANEQLRVLVTAFFDLSNDPISYNLTVTAQ